MKRHNLSEHAVNMFVAEIPSEYISLKDFALQLRRAIIEYQRDKCFRDLLSGETVPSPRKSMESIEQKFERIIFQLTENFAIINPGTNDVYVIPEQIIDSQQGSKYFRKEISDSFKMQMEDVGRITNVEELRCHAFLYVDPADRKEIMGDIFNRQIWPRTETPVQPVIP